jgi:hypothetical protein
MSTFVFKPRWKEELECQGPGGSFILELPMGMLRAYLPTDEAWCEANGAQFVIDESANVF